MVGGDVFVGAALVAAVTPGEPTSASDTADASARPAMTATVMGCFLLIMSSPVFEKTTLRAGRSRSASFCNRPERGIRGVGYPAGSRTPASTLPRKSAPRPARQSALVTTYGTEWPVA